MSPPTSTNPRTLKGMRKSSSTPLLPPRISRDPTPNEGDTPKADEVDTLEPDQSDDEDESPELVSKQSAGPPAPDALPEGLYANFLVSCIGLATATLLTVFIPICHWTGIEPFRWPSSPQGAAIAWGSLAVVAFGGAIYVSGLHLSSRSARLNDCRTPGSCGSSVYGARPRRPSPTC